MLSDLASLPTKVAAAWPPERWRGVTAIVAVSGGADSVALLRALLSLRLAGEGRLVMAHFNHRLRGSESDADEAFVARLAEQWNLEFRMGAPATELAAGGSGEGIEGAARQARYDFLAAAASDCGARYVATAHTADDQVETIIFNVLRGTGLAGLAGIPRVRKLNTGAVIVRPLLGVTRDEVEAYLQSLNQAYRDDATNRSEDFTRNRIRLQLLPLLERDFNPHVRDALLRLSQIAGEAEDEIDRAAEDLLAQIGRPVEGGVELAVKPLAFVSDFFARSVLMAAWRQQGWPLQSMSHARWVQLATLARDLREDGTPQPAQALPGGIRAEREHGMLRLSRAFD